MTYEHETPTEAMARTTAAFIRRLFARCDPFAERVEMHEEAHQLRVVREQDA